MRTTLSLLLALGVASGTLICDPTALCDTIQRCQAGLTCSNIDSTFGIGQCCYDPNSATTRSLYTNYPLYGTTSRSFYAYTSLPGLITANPVIGVNPTSSFGCQDLVNPSTGISDCFSSISLCQDSQYYDIMTRQCPKTCGSWRTTTYAPISGSCLDRLNPKTGVSDCASQSYLCSNSMYQSLMREQCPRTCGFCSGNGFTTMRSTMRFNTIFGSSSTTIRPGSCADMVNTRTGMSDCPQLAYLCARSNYAFLMRNQCPRTCGFC